MYVRGWHYSALGLNRVRTLEHIVNILKVVCARRNGRDIALGSIVLLKVGLLPEVAHLQLVSFILPSDQSEKLTASYVSGGTARRSVSLEGMFSTFEMLSVLDTTRNEQKLAARPEP